MTKSKRILFFVLLLTLIVQSATSAQQLNHFKPKKKLIKIAEKSIYKSARQYHLLMQELPGDRFPVTYYAGQKRLVTSGSEPWVGGFFPGALLYLYEFTKDTSLYKEALRKMKVLEKEKYNKTTHDLGFMMYCSFGNAYRLQPELYYREVIITSAKSLATRFSTKVGCIRSWDSGPSQFMVIIDNMMNLELLFEATRLTGDSSFYKIAIAHANTTMQNHFRPDYSSYHLVIYDPQNGTVIKRQTVQGAFDSSAWARGQAWGLYGYTMCYRETKDKKYLDQANHIAQFILHHFNLPKDKIPYWDFNATDIPNEPRDASAGAIICSALIELAQYVPMKTGKGYLKAAEQMLKSLTSSTYSAAIGENGGFILKHGVGNYPRKADVDVPLIYTDYYFTEALTRYRNLKRQQYVL
jgi:unsaturated chondroitin disaccharide hydrolase